MHKHGHEREREREKDLEDELRNDEKGEIGIRKTSETF